uniref:Uncharacterized protein n=1 Tax=Mucochytrium quahogii TaxID=96639 RepID=A0A7S2W593_9STRA|mmetsp:Transcript_13578/g.29210  ORF Transcript_13578/g.29210 Transcript_13578/m.29210 type:complete len:457 (+) Transcript_13578:401-1771(+)
MTRRKSQRSHKRKSLGLRAIPESEELPLTGGKNYNTRAAGRKFGVDVTNIQGKLFLDTPSPEPKKETLEVVRHVADTPEDLLRARENAELTICNMNAAGAASRAVLVNSTRFGSSDSGDVSGDVGVETDDVIEYETECEASKENIEVTETGIVEHVRTNQKQVSSPVETQVSTRRATVTPSYSHGAWEVRDFFGEFVCDLGESRLYKISARQFVDNIPPWYEQRPLREARAKLIAEEQMDLPRIHFMGVLTVFNYAHLERANSVVKQEVGLIDGQHRQRAMKILLETFKVPDFFVLMQVYPVKCNLDVSELFLNVNLGESVLTMDKLPSSVQDIVHRLNQSVSEACDKLQAAYPKMFSPKTNCKRPNVNIDGLRDKIYSRLIEVMDKESQGRLDAQELFDKIIKVNNTLAEIPEEKWPKERRRNFKKARENGFFLGMEPLWIEQLVPLIQNPEVNP